MTHKGPGAERPHAKGAGRPGTKSGAGKKFGAPAGKAAKASTGKEGAHTGRGYQKGRPAGKGYGKKPYRKAPQRRGPSRVREEGPERVDDGYEPIRFEELPISDAVKLAVEAMGFQETTPIQTACILPLLEGRDVVGQAQTGTGKTAAFGIPLIEAAGQGKRGLILAPTRELAKQVQQELQALGKGSPVEAICVVGGASFGDQVRALKRHPTAIIVATPGRVVDHLGRGTMDLGDIAMFVLDEADEMLSMGFQDELDAIIDTLPEKRQNAMFSATMAPGVVAIAKKALHNPITVRVARGPAPGIEQWIAEVAGRDRMEAVARILDAEQPASALLFARTRQRVEDLAAALAPRGAEALHGGLGQPVREGVMKRMRGGATKLLVATDVAARGLDVDSIELVLHDDLPGDVDTYIHRIGRTGRAGRTGASIVLLGPGKMRHLHPFERRAGKLKRYFVPDDDAIQAARGQRLVEELAHVEPTKAANLAFEAAVAEGMPPDVLARRLLQLALGVQPASDMPVGTAAIALKVGTMDNVHAGSIVGVLTHAGGLRGEDVGRIDVLPRMSVVEVPRDQLESVCASLGRAKLSGRALLPREAEDWHFKAAR